MTQNNLGNALCTLGEREDGTERLEQAALAHHAALEVFRPAGAGCYVAGTWAKRAFSEPELAPYSHLAHPRLRQILLGCGAERRGIDVLRVVHGARDLDALDLDLP